MRFSLFFFSFFLVDFISCATQSLSSTLSSVLSTPSPAFHSSPQRVSPPVAFRARADPARAFETSNQVPSLSRTHSLTRSPRHIRASPDSPLSAYRLLDLAWPGRHETHASTAYEVSTRGAKIDSLAPQLSICRVKSCEENRVTRPSLSVSSSATSSLVVSPSTVPAMVSSASSWTPTRKVVRCRFRQGACRPPGIELSAHHRLSLSAAPTRSKERGEALGASSRVAALRPSRDDHEDVQISRRSPNVDPCHGSRAGDDEHLAH